MAPSERNDIDINSVLDRIIEFSERNLNSQSEFLSKIYEIRNRFESSDRDHKDMGADIKAVLGVLNVVIERMKSTSNEDLLDVLEIIRTNSSNIDRKSDDTLKEVKTLTDTFVIIRNILGAVSILLVAIQIASSLYFGIKKQAEVKDTVNAVIEEIEKKNAKLYNK